MKLSGMALALASVLLIGCIQSASAQVVIERRAIVGGDVVDLSIDGLLGPGVLVRPGAVTRTITTPMVVPRVTTRTVTMPRVITHSRVLTEVIPAVDPLYKPGIYMPGRYSGSRVIDLNSIVLPTVNF